MIKVLLIDDDKDDAALFKEALHEVNPSFFFYWYDGCEAIDLLKDKKIPSPDIIFLDINMPALSGWDCLKMLKDRTELKDVPVIMYTTSSRATEKEIAKELGATGFITKPNSYQSLKAALESVLPKNGSN